MGWRIIQLEDTLLRLVLLFRLIISSIRWTNAQKNDIELSKQIQVNTQKKRLKEVKTTSADKEEKTTLRAKLTKQAQPMKSANRTIQIKLTERLNLLKRPKRNQTVKDD